ncbi:hypothetical protein A3K93_05875 [Acinetobacter sp. NCu2D-2]|uniref:hypothetical protein n=1 Tax=Acinetobacter sp. NCu2D-2 TaxID=1608473 RepID=UPI0007CE06E5|nr:hypothetical protein [Acinetobacter sp. NCu2D-2]ANF81760.1 hypothetical protein A3K93_05875 [Acinetobacter sp. NCu2D-2]
MILSWSKLGLSLSMLISLSVHAVQLTQAEYDQFIDVQTKIVNETKPILDQSNPDTSASAQREAFCLRLKAYENIKATSEENINLNMAPMMKIVAESYLSRQQESLTNSGMTTSVFCASAKQTK